MKNGRFKIFEEFFKLLRVYFPIRRFVRWGTKFPDTFCFIVNEKAIESLVNIGFKRKNLILTGNPTYDLPFQKLQKFKPTPKKDHKIRVLFLTVNLQGQGGRWTKSLRDSMIKKLVTKISKLVIF